MQTFKEFSFQDEALSMASRMKMKAAMRRNKGKIKLGRKKAAKKLASPEKLKQRSRKQARELIIKKLLKDKKKAELSYAARQDLEKRVAKKQGAILKIAKKLLPKIKVKERERLKAFRAQQG
jgi:di/tripeptidase